MTQKEGIDATAAPHSGRIRRRFTVRAEGLSDDNPYVGAVTLNGRPLDRSVVTHEQILAGGELAFTMSAEPNRTWATAPEARPYSMTPYPR